MEDSFLDEEAILHRWPRRWPVPTVWTAQRMLLKKYIYRQVHAPIYVRVCISVNMQEPWELSETDIRERIFTQCLRVRSKKDANVGCNLLRLRFFSQRKEKRIYGFFLFSFKIRLYRLSILF